MLSSPKYPIIGITVDYENSGGYSKFPWYALRGNYSDVVSMVGGVPVLIPHEPSKTKEYISSIDGLIISGGAFDVNPQHYQDDSIHKSVVLKEKRTNFELNLIEYGLEKDLPVLGICGGEQILNVALGGTLIQHIPDQIVNSLEHEQKNPRDEAGHSIKIIQDTLIHRIVRVTNMQVNSAHHQAVLDTSKFTIVNAIASDGVIEGIESTQHRFCLGVQWHPEFCVDPNDKNIFKALVEAAGQ